MIFYPLDLDMDEDYRITDGVDVSSLLLNLTNDQGINSVYNHNYFHVVMVF